MQPTVGVFRRFVGVFVYCSMANHKNHQKVDKQIANKRFRAMVRDAFAKGREFPRSMKEGYDRYYWRNTP